MKEEYLINSDRYNRIHRFVLANDDWYFFQPQNEWMTLNIIYGKDINDIKSVDTDGGPMLHIGWKNNEIEVVDIKNDKNTGSPIFKLSHIRD